MRSYLPELDGLRAIAVVGVMLYHTQTPGFSWGWMGVPFFFVLSGFLITGILIDAKGGRRFLRDFYVRRSLRIFPIYYMAVAICAGYLLYYGVGIDHFWMFLTYQQNHVGLMHEAPGSLYGMLGQSWSLAVEEQFYLVWPFIVLVLSRRGLWYFCVGLVVLAPLARTGVWWFDGSTQLVEKLLVCHMDALAWGALLAMALRSLHRSALNGATAGAALAMAAGVSIVITLAQGRLAPGTPGGVHPGYVWMLQATAMSAGFAAIVYLVAYHRSPIAVVLRSPPLRHVGQISYGLYLYHIPVYNILDHQFSLTQWQTPLRVGLTYAVAVVSWHVIEKPVLGLKHRWAPRPEIDASPTMSPHLTGDTPGNFLTRRVPHVDADSAAG